jgi:hypothetical protein
MHWQSISCKRVSQPINSETRQCVKSIRSTNSLLIHDVIPWHLDTSSASLLRSREKQNQTSVISHTHWYYVASIVQCGVASTLARSCKLQVALKALKNPELFEHPIFLLNTVETAFLPSKASVWEKLYRSNVEGQPYSTISVTSIDLHSHSKSRGTNRKLGKLCAAKRSRSIFEKLRVFSVTMKFGRTESESLHTLSQRSWMMSVAVNTWR